MPASRIFIINPKGELRQPDPSTSPPSDDIDHDPELGLGIASPRAPPLPLPPAPRALPPTLSSLAAINDLVHHIFPPLVAGEPLAVAVTHLSAAAAAAAVVAAVTDGEEREQQQRQQQEEEGSKEGRDGDEDGPPQLVALGGREQGAAGGWQGGRCGFGGVPARGCKAAAAGSTLYRDCGCLWILYRDALVVVLLGVRPYHLLQEAKARRSATASVW